MQLLYIARLDGEDDGVVPFVQLERAVLRVRQVDRVVLPGMEEDVFYKHWIVIDVSVPVGEISGDFDGVLSYIRRAIIIRFLRNKHQDMPWEKGFHIYHNNRSVFPLPPLHIQFRKEYL